MEFVKYKGLISKVVNSSLYSSEIITQQSQTFTHLKYFVTSKDIEPIKEKVQTINFENYLALLSDKGFFQDLTKVEADIIMELVLEQASEDLVWIDDLHDVEYKSSIQKILQKYLN